MYSEFSSKTLWNPAERLSSSIQKTQHIIGSTRFYGYDPEKSEIEIGWTFLARKYWGGRYNAEMKRLLLTHAFKFVENVVFFVGEENLRSQKATEKIGADKVVRRSRVDGIVQRHSTKGYLIRKPLTKVHR